MLRTLCGWLLYKVCGWTKEVSVSHPKKYIICLAPHTSNWDFVLGQLYSHADGVKINFLMKKEWFFFPLGALFRRLGGIPVNRQKKGSMTDALAETAQQSEVFRLCVTPEGTRKSNPEWKKGFYYIALKAGLPILLYGEDYERKLIQCTKVVVPTGDIDREMAEIKEYFKNFKGKHPEQFAV
ncbi:MAG: 1-acyl-sn-glycerol-3-phosphate acyltransferase [Prevotella sp.]|nr:1-acyl-sn-glycerol-3-phosphate acyltransferase [Prevotella sp.]